jgi:hypothetical protein
MASAYEQKNKIVSQRLLFAYQFLFRFAVIDFMIGRVEFDFIINYRHHCSVSFCLCQGRPFHVPRWVLWINSSFCARSLLAIRLKVSHVHETPGISLSAKNEEMSIQKRILQLAKESCKTDNYC